MQTKTNQKFEVYATVTLPVSIDVEATSHENALAIGQYQLSQLSVDTAILTLIKVDGKVITPKTHDVEIDVENVFAEE
jgi:hypothetical protein